MIPGKKLSMIILFLFVLFGFSISAYALKSVYVISDTQISEIFAYKIDGSILDYQTDYICELDPIYDDGAVGLAIDQSWYGWFLFVTIEYSNKIEIVNAKTMQYVDAVTAPGARNLAGVAMDTGKRKLYAMDRYTNHLYSWSWGSNLRTILIDFVEKSGIICYHI